MIVKVFTQPNCPKCPAAKDLVASLKKNLLVKKGKLKIEEYDVSDIDGLAEASFYSVLSTPSFIVCDDQGKEISGWRGEIPGENEITSLLDQTPVEP